MVKVIDVLNKPYTVEEIKEFKNNNYISGTVVVDLNNVVKMTADSFTDFLSTKLIGDDTLMDVSWCCIGVNEDHDLLIEVSGDVSSFLDLIEA